MWIIFNTVTDQTIKYFNSYEEAAKFYDGLSAELQSIHGINLMD